MQEFSDANIDWIDRMDPNFPYTRYITEGMEQDKIEHDRFLSEIKEKNRQTSHDMFLSYESFSMYEISAFYRLKEDFLEYEIRIIHIYRDPMSHMLSFYNQMNKGWGPRQLTRSFGSDLFGMMTSSPYVRLAYSDPTVLQRCSDVFGRDAIRIVDMVGSAQAGKDISYTVYCEVIGVLCNKPDLFKNTDAAGKNPTESLTMLHVNSFFIGFLANVKASNVADGASRGVCQYCSEDYYLAGKWFKNWYSQKILPRNPNKYRVPTTVANLTMFVPYMDNMVSEVWDKYGDLILHGDKPAVLAAIRRKTSMETLDVEGFFHKLPWYRIFEEALADGKKSPGLLCNC